MSRLFGTDGIRGTAGKYPIDVATISKLARSLLQLGKKRILIGRDTRASGLWIEKILEEIIFHGGGEATLAGVIPTPGVAFLTKSASFDVGVVISASHNSYQDNGIKIFSSSGTKLTDDQEKKVEQLVAEDTDLPSVSAVRNEDSIREILNFHPVLIDKYSNFLKTVCLSSTLQPLKIVLDCANGASFHMAPQVFEALGAEVVSINTQPNGRNINRNCGAVFPQGMIRTVLSSQASFGVAFDGDSDRCIFCDERGELIDGDQILFILACYLHRKGLLRTRTVVTTLVSNMGLDVALEKENLRLIRTRVGDRYVLREMLHGDHYLGGEQSGHIIVREYLLSGDGVLTALLIGRILVESVCTLSTLAKGLEKYPQVLLNVKVKEKRDYSNIDEIQKEIGKAQRSLGTRGRVLVRYSGTEPLVRIMLEGEEETEIRRRANSIAAVFKKILGTTTST